jgi:hypothetical protein
MQQAAINPNLAKQHVFAQQQAYVNNIDNIEDSDSDEN